jgi:hypothetical protein
VPADPPAKASSELTDPTVIARWALGLGATWLVLTLLVDLGPTRELGVAFAFLVTGSVIIIHGPDALKNLGFLT